MLKDINVLLNDILLLDIRVVNTIRDKKKSFHLSLEDQRDTLM